MKKLILLSIMLTITLSIVAQKKKWKEAQKINTIESYHEFWTTYPESEYSDDAKLILTELEFNKIKKRYLAMDDEINILPAYREIGGVEYAITAFERFLKLYPQSKFDTEAKNCLQELKKIYKEVKFRDEMFRIGSTSYGVSISKEKVMDKDVYSAYDSVIFIQSTFGFETDGGTLVMKNGQWIPAEGTKVSGQFSLIVKLDDLSEIFPTKITGTKIINGQTIYLCENGESFYLKGQTAHPFEAMPLNTGIEILENLIDEYRTNKTEKLAWKIWKIISKK